MSWPPIIFQTPGHRNHIKEQAMAEDSAHVQHKCIAGKSADFWAVAPVLYMSRRF